MTKKEICFEFQKKLAPLVTEGVVTSMSVPIIVQMAIDALEQHSDSIIETLMERIKSWETDVANDKTLYSLGLRHAVDILQEEDPDRFLVEGTGVAWDDVS